MRIISGWQERSGLVLVDIVAMLERISGNDSPGELSEELTHGRRCLRNKKKAASNTITCLSNSFDYCASQIHPMSRMPSPKQMSRDHHW